MATVQDNVDLEVDFPTKRKEFNDFQDKGVAALPPLASSLEEFYCDLPVSDGWQSRCKVIKPKSEFENNGNNVHPLIVYFYGGGFAMGGPEQVTQPAREWAERYHATVVCPTYRPPPEFPWPQSFKDGWDIVSYLSQNVENDRRFGRVSLRDGFIVGGVSAGAGVAGVIGGISVVTESDPVFKLDPAVERLSSPITGLFLAVPVLLHVDMIPPGYKKSFTAWDDNRHDPGMDTAAMMRTFHHLKCTDYKSPWFSPVNVLERALPESTHGLNIEHHPRVYLQACAFDPLRDDALIYEKMLKDVGQGQRVKLDFFPLDSHTAWTALPLEMKSKDPTIKEATIEGMKWLLETN